MKVSVEKPGSPTDVLEHHGVKGQKWGVRRQTARSAGKIGKTAAKEASRAGSGRVEARRAGRAAATSAVRESRAQRPASFSKRFPTSAQRTAEIRRARIQTHQDVLNALKEPKGSAKRKEMEKVWLNNPDRATGLRMTRGEKVVVGILAGGLAVPSLGAAPAALAGYTGTTVAIRKGIERGQRKRASQ